MTVPLFACLRSKSISLLPENLCRWLETKTNQIGSLNFDEMQFSGRKIIELIRAFEEMLGKLQFVHKISVIRVLCGLI